MKIKRAIKYWWQRQTRGWDDSECWSLDTTIAKFILPRLKRFRNGDKHETAPLYLSREEWCVILDKMIVAFEFHASPTKYTEDAPSPEVTEGLNLFAKWFDYLWW